MARGGRHARSPRRLMRKTGTHPIFSIAKKWGPCLFVLFLACALGQARAQEQRTLELENGARVSYALRLYPPDAHLLDANAVLQPLSALDTAKLVTRYLAEGKVEDASLLSNAPKARYARLRESFEGWSEADYQRAYARYFDPANRIVGEIAIDSHRLLIWHLRDTDYLAAFFLVDIEGRLLIDDVPNETRANLRRILQAYRDGKLK
jgi:hypothetical protein